MAYLRLTFAVVTTMVVAYMHFPTMLARTSYVVGGANGWGMPQKPNHYETWAKGKKFIKGDALYWVFKEGQHTVGEVGKEAYDTCNTTAGKPPLDTSGQLILILDKAAIHYFICTIHCSRGVKVVIDVKDS